VPYGRVSSDWWDADHIVPVIEGGGECGIDNFRTLCIPCHKAETAALRKRMARRRIEAKELPLLLVESEAK
jgi:5-methylcytosine-specific restriction protein A